MEEWRGMERCTVEVEMAGVEKNIIIKERTKVVFHEITLIPKI